MDWKKLLYPPLGVLGLLTLGCILGLVWVFQAGWELTVPAYFLYGLSTYTLVVDLVFCVLRLPGILGWFRAQVDKIPLGHRYLTDRNFSTRISVYLSLAMNLAYVALQGIQWHRFHSWWFVVLLGYYAILSALRFLLARFIRTHTLGTDLPGEWRSSRICAVILLLVNLSLSAAVLMILYQDRGFAYDGLLIYVMAAYTFYSTIHAVVEMVKYRKLESPILSTTKAVSLSAALVSMLNLETAMFSQFGADMAQQDQNLMIMLTGAGISLAVVAMSLGLIFRANREIRSQVHGAA